MYVLLCSLRLVELALQNRVVVFFFCFLLLLFCCSCWRQIQLIYYKRIYREKEKKKRREFRIMVSLRTAYHSVRRNADGRRRSESMCPCVYECICPTLAIQ